jgi:hypothetical protein
LRIIASFPSPAENMTDAAESSLSASAGLNHASSASNVFIKPFPLSDAITAAVAGLATSTKNDQEFSGQMFLLAAKVLTESKNWSKMAISRDSWNKVSELRAQIMRESDQASLFPVLYQRQVTPMLDQQEKSHVNDQD